jgi:hypothetical protein
MRLTGVVNATDRRQTRWRQATDTWQKALSSGSKKTSMPSKASCHKINTQTLLQSSWQKVRRVLQIRAEWREFLAALASNGVRPPDFLDREINAYLAIQKRNSNTDNSAGMLINPGADGAGDKLEEGRQDDWMHGADDKFVLIDDDVEDKSGLLEWSKQHHWDVLEDTYSLSVGPLVAILIFLLPTFGINLHAP